MIFQIEIRAKPTYSKTMQSLQTIENVLVAMENNIRICVLVGIENVGKLENFIMTNISNFVYIVKCFPRTFFALYLCLCLMAYLSLVFVKCMSVVKKSPKKKLVYESENNVIEITPDEDEEESVSEKDCDEDEENRTEKIRNAIKKCCFQDTHESSKSEKDCGEEFADWVDEDLEYIREKVRKAEKDNVLYNITTHEYNKVSTVKKNPKIYIADYEKCIVYKIANSDKIWQKSQKDYFEFVRKFI